MGNSKLAGQNKSNPLLTSTSNEELADDFANYFLEKILNIRKLFDGIPNYKPNPIDIPQLNKFSTLSETQFYKIIMEMPSRTCD